MVVIQMVQQYRLSFRCDRNRFCYAFMPNSEERMSKILKSIHTNYNNKKYNFQLEETFLDIVDRTNRLFIIDPNTFSSRAVCCEV